MLQPGSKTAPSIERIARSARAAAGRVAGRVRVTPLQYSYHFSAISGADVHCKLENLQLTGSFKLRGAFNRLLTLSDEERGAGCVVASSGNHGAAVAHAMRELGVTGIVFVPEQASSTKVRSIRESGAEVRRFGSDGLDTERQARRFAAENGMTYVSPYNDLQVIAGQGTCGVEIVQQLPDADVVYIATGGGGLLAGVGSVLLAHNPRISVIACQPENSAVMASSFAAGHIVEEPSLPTLSDGTAGGIEQDSVTFPLCQQVAERFVLVTESAIAAAMREYMDAEHQLVEGAAGVVIAAFLADAKQLEGKKVVLLICGANVSRSVLAGVLAAD